MSADHHNFTAPHSRADAERADKHRAGCDSRPVPSVSALMLPAADPAIGEQHPAPGPGKARRRVNFRRGTSLRAMTGGAL